MRSVILALALLFSCHAFGAISVTGASKQCEDGTIVSSVTCTYAASLTSGSTLFAVVRLGAQPRTITCSDPTNGNWTEYVHAVDTTNNRIVSIQYFPNNAATTAVTVTCSFVTTDGSFKALDILEATGMQTSSITDGNNSSCPTASTTTPSSGTITTTNATDIFIGAYTFSTSSTVAFTEDANFVQQLSDTFGVASHNHTNVGTRIVTATETRAYAPTIGSAAVGCVVVAAFKGTNPAGGATNKPQGFIF